MTLLALAIAPGIAIMLYVYLRDEFEREPLHLLLFCFIGGLISTVPAVLVSQFGHSVLDAVMVKGTTPYNLALAFPVVAFSEELSKFIFIFLIAYRNKNFDEPYDGIVYAVMVGMGFATLENILYVMDGGVTTGILRMLTAVPAHATFAVLMGYFLGLAKFKPEQRGFFIINALLWPILFHGAYDYSLFDSVNYPLAALGALASLVVGLRLSFKALIWHQEVSPHKNIHV